MTPLVQETETGHAPAPAQSSVRPMTSIELQQDEDLEWAATAPEVRQHVGKFVVIHKQRVVAVGTDRRSLVEQAAEQEQCPWWELVVEIVPGADLWETPK